MYMLKFRGITLIELMIVVAIVGILAAIAYPSYRDQILKSNRADAKMLMMQNAQDLERCYTRTNTFVGCTLTATATTNGRYAFTVAPAASTYVITGTRQGAQLSDTQCGDLTLNETGQKAPTTTGCW
jgi:type IV pilus assembly protein PilE